MITKETWQEIAKRTGIEADKLQSAITSDKEEQIALAKVNLFSDEELTAFETNKKKEAYESGKVAGSEMRMKELKEISGLTIEGYKDPKVFVDAFKTQIISEANINPDKKVLELNTKYDTLLKTYETEKDQWLQKENEFAQKITQREIDFTIHSIVPEKLPEGLTKEDVILITKNRFQFENKDGKMIIKKDGQAVVDKTGNNRPVNEVLTEFFIERKFMTTAGRGEGSSQSDGMKGDFSLCKNASDVIDWCDANGIPMNQHANYVAKAKKENKDFKNY